MERSPARRGAARVRSAGVDSAGLCVSALLILAAASLLIACSDTSSVSPREAKTSTPSVIPTGSGVADLTWDAVTAPNLQGYRVYYGTASGKYIQALGQGVSAGNSTAYQLTNLNNQTTYYMVVTAFDTLGNESPYSNEVSKAIP